MHAAVVQESLYHNTVMHLSMLRPTTPRAGSIGGFVGGFYTFVPGTAPRAQGICNQRIPRLCLRVRMRIRHVLFHRKSVRSEKMDVEVEKTVLVRLQTSSGSRNRPVTFRGGKKELACATKEKFSDVLLKDSELYFQMRDTSWGIDEFLDIQDQEIPQRAVLNAVETKKVSIRIKELPGYLYSSLYDTVLPLYCMFYINKYTARI